MNTYVRKKKNMRFQSVDSLQQVVNVINEASIALKDPNRTIRHSALSEILTGVVGASMGGVISFGALYGLGTVGLSAAGITSGLAAAGGGASLLLGGALSPMVAGLFVLSAPVAALAAGGVGVAAHLRRKQLCQEKERLYVEVLKKDIAILNAQEQPENAGVERQDYLNSLHILLSQALKDLKHDLGI